MELVKVKCPDCGANLEANQDLDGIVCNYCGTKVLINDEATRITRIEKAKLQSRKNNYEQTVYEEKEKNKSEWKEIGRGWLVVLLLFGGTAIIGLLFSLICPQNPSLSDYNSLELGMTYLECKEILGKDGHLIEETETKNVYVWYDNYSSKDDDCQEIIRLEFKEGKLISRKENGLK